MSCFLTSSYTIAIDSSGILTAVNRSSGRTSNPCNLNNGPVAISKSSTSFCVVGTNDPIDASFTTPLSGNTVNIDTSCVLQIASGKSVDLALHSVQISLASGTLTFTEI